MRALRGLGLLLLWLACCGASPASGEPVPTLAAIKAAFLFQFGNYTDWPRGSFPAEDAPLVIAVAGDADVARELSAIVRGRTVLGRRVDVRRIEDPADAQAALGAHIVYVGPEAAGLLRSLEGRPSLLVTGPARGLPPGSMIHFVIDDSRLRFDVSLEATAAAGLRISSRLLGVARRVSGTP